MPDTNAAPNRRGRGLFYLFLVVVVVAGVWWYADRGDQTSQPSGRGGMVAGMRGGFGGPVPVRVAEATQQSINHVLQAIGTVTAFNTVTVRSRVEGELQEILFSDGEAVEKGDVLARIDPRTYQVQLDQALGQLAQTQAQLKNAEQDLARYQQLFAQKSIARQQLDTQAALVEQLRATRTANQASVESARLQLGFTEITAPISGRLGLRQVDVGNLIAPNSTEGLVVITQTQPISVQFSVPQADLPSVLAPRRSGRTLAVDVYGSDNTTLIERGELTAVDNQIDTATGTVNLKARLPNDEQTLFPNQFVNVKLLVDSGESLAVPTAAVQYGSIGAFVYVIDDENRAHIQEVVPGQVDGRQVAINAGLSLGDKVVTEGIDRLRQGTEVDIVPDDQPELSDGTAGGAGLLSSDPKSGQD